MTREATRWMSFSSSTSSTRGRETSSGSGLAGGVKSSWCSWNLRSQSALGALDQNRLLYAAGALQKHWRQCGHTSVRSLTRHEHHDESRASNVEPQWWQATEYVSGFTIDPEFS